jgi:hypothetical protein
MPFPTAEIDAARQIGVPAAKAIANAVIAGQKVDPDQFVFLNSYTRALYAWAAQGIITPPLNLPSNPPTQDQIDLANKEVAGFASRISVLGTAIQTNGNALNRAEMRQDANEAKRCTDIIKEFSGTIAGLEEGLVKHYKAKFNPQVLAKPDEIFPGVTGGSTDSQILKLVQEIHKALGL